MSRHFNRYYLLVQRVANWHEYILHKFGLLHRNEYTFRLRRQDAAPLLAYVPLRMLQTFKEIFLANEYLQKARLPFNPVVLDVGANVGYFSLQVLQQYPAAKVYAFEPMPQNFRLLQRHVDGNPGSFLKPELAAVSSTNETITLQYDAKDEFTTSASINGGGAEPDTLEVRCMTLAEIMRKEGIDHIDLLKLDCEGSEYSILFTLPDELFARIGNISMEAHVRSSPNENIESLDQLLQAKGFKTMKSGMLLSAWRE